MGGGEDCSRLNQPASSRSSAGARSLDPMICRFILFAVLLGITAAALAEDSPRRVLEAKRLHLGVAGMAEWQEFDGSTPHGTHLDLTFSAEANVADATLLIRQRNVKTTWNVLLNGRKLGALETLTQPLVRALAIPAGALKDGDNLLSIARAPSRLLDDIVVGEIVLERRPLADVLGRATLEIAVTDADGGGALPSRLTLVDGEESLVPLHAVAGQSLAVRTGVVYTGDGKARLGVAPGDYILYASRGFEYSVDRQRVTIVAGETKRVALKIRREVPTPGLIASDTHIHTLTFSKHGDATVDERMLTIAGEGIELAVATDHNHHADFREPAGRMAVSAHFTPVVGNEVSTKVGHFNAFPVAPGGPLPDATLTDWIALLHNVRSVTGAQVVTLNHPRDVHQNFTPFAPENFDAVTGEIKIAPTLACDAIEVVTSAAMQSDLMLLYRDWFALLNRGFKIAAIAASDTHHVSEFILGQARTYVACRATDPARIEIEEICTSYRAGRLLVSLGLLATITVNERFGVGDLATGLGEEIRVNLEVLGPSWVRADRVELFANGIKIREQAIEPSERVLKARLAWTIPRPKHDVHLVAIATGPGVTAPFWETPRPYQPTSKIFTPRVVGSTNPIWIDADGDGQFTSARGYAMRVMDQTKGEAEKVKSALADYDAAVAVQVADLESARLVK